jgi:hypothetical protein
MGEEIIVKMVKEKAYHFKQKVPIFVNTVWLCRSRRFCCSCCGGGR